MFQISFIILFQILLNSLFIMLYFIFQAAPSIIVLYKYSYAILWFNDFNVDTSVTSMESCMDICFGSYKNILAIKIIMTLQAKFYKAFT